jgi:hypothetical protein
MPSRRETLPIGVDQQLTDSSAAFRFQEPEIGVIWKQKRKQTLVWLSNRKSQKDPGWRDGGANRFFSGFSVAF